jgi:hypothetical protein
MNYHVVSLIGDPTDSTVLRNLCVGLRHSLLENKATIRGISRVQVGYQIIISFSYPVLSDIYSHCSLKSTINLLNHQKRHLPSRRLHEIYGTFNWFYVFYVHLFEFISCSDKDKVTI